MAKFWNIDSQNSATYNTLSNSATEQALFWRAPELISRLLLLLSCEGILTGSTCILATWTTTSATLVYQWLAHTRALEVTEAHVTQHQGSLSMLSWPDLMVPIRSSETTSKMNLPITKCREYVISSSQAVAKFSQDMLRSFYSTTFGTWMNFTSLMVSNQSRPSPQQH